MRDEAIAGFNIMRIQDQFGLTQKELARAGEIDPGQITHYISGEIFPRGETIYKISRRYGIDINEFFVISDGKLKRAKYEKPFDKGMFSRNLQRILKEQDVPALRVAEWADLDNSGMYRLKLGKSQPNYMTLLKLSRALQVDPSEFYR